MTTLVTGATGTIGNQVARLLLAAGHSIRVASRRPEALADLDADTPGTAQAVALDLEDPSTFARAFAGVDTLFLVGPLSRDSGEQVKVIVKAAADAGVRHIVRYSAAGASTDAAFHLARQHGLADEAVAGSGIAWTLLHPTFYMDNLITYQGDAIRGQGAFYGASGDGKASYISSADIAAVAAKILTEPAAHAGQRYALTGPEALDGHSLAAALTEVLGKTIRYVDVGDDGMRQSMKERDTPEWFVESMVGLEQVKRNGWAADVSPAVQQVLGRPPERLRDFLRRNADRLR